MLPIDTILVFVAASVALGLAPGPDNIFVLTQSALYGRKAGLVVTIGLCTGLLFHTAAVAFGVAVIFQTSQTAFAILKFVGASYLIYLAWGAFRAGKLDIGQAGGEGGSISLQALYGRGIVMNITNPKVAIFFLAFLPQFTDPAQGPVTTQILLLGCFFILSAIVVFSSVAIGAGFIGNWLRNSPKAQIVMNRIAGGIFVGLALRLAMTEQ